MNVMTSIHQVAAHKLSTQSRVVMQPLASKCALINLALDLPWTGLEWGGGHKLC